VISRGPFLSSIESRLKYSLMKPTVARFKPIFCTDKTNCLPFIFKEAFALISNCNPMWNRLKWIFSQKTPYHFFAKIFMHFMHKSANFPIMAKTGKLVCLSFDKALTRNIKNRTGEYNWFSYSFGVYIPFKIKLEFLAIWNFWLVGFFILWWPIFCLINL